MGAVVSRADVTEWAETLVVLAVVMFAPVAVLKLAAVVGILP